jgi:RNA polymerase sigma factor (sigma-70 family)
MGPSIPVRLLKTQSDARLVELARQGHERAFEALVLRYRRALLGYCRRLPLSGGLAEDALQQGFLQAWLALQSGTEVRDPKPWLYRIVRNAALNMRRGAPVEHTELSETLCGNDAPEDELNRRVAMRGVLAGLVALPEHQREALLRTAVEGHSHEQVAAALGLSDGAVRGLVYRARATLRAAATAITPTPFLNWALSSGARGGPSMAGIIELATGGGSVGLGGLLLKGSVVVATAGALVTTIGGSHPHGTVASHHAQRASVTPAHGVATSEPPSKPSVSSLIADRPRPAVELVHRAPAARTAPPRTSAAASAQLRASAPGGIANRSGDSGVGDHSGEHGGSGTSTGGGGGNSSGSGGSSDGGDSSGTPKSSRDSGPGSGSTDGGRSSGTPKGSGDGGSGSPSLDRGSSNNVPHSSGDGGASAGSSDGGSSNTLNMPSADVSGTSGASGTPRPSGPSDGGGAGSPPSGEASGGDSGSGSGSGSSGGGNGSGGLLATTAAPSTLSSGGG